MADLEEKLKMSHIEHEEIFDKLENLRDILAKLKKERHILHDPSKRGVFEEILFSYSFCYIKPFVNN